MSYPPPPGQYPPPPPPPPGQQPGQYAVVSGLPVLRGRTLRRVGWSLLLASIVLFVVGGVLYETTALSKVKDFQRVQLSPGGTSPIIATGSGTVHLSKGKVVVYYEASGANDLKNHIPVPYSELTSPSGQKIQTYTLYGGGDVRQNKKIKDSLNYSKDGHDGVAVLQFTAPETGDYQVTVDLIGSTAKPGADAAFGPDIDTQSNVALTLVGVGMALFIGAVVVLIIGYVKRRRHKKEITQHGYVVALQPGQQPPPPPGYQPPPPPGYDDQFKPPPG
jgi:hypothetical protein